jgi:hypothetical protein
MARTPGCPRVPLSLTAPLCFVVWFSTLVRFSDFKGKAVRASNYSVSGDGTCLANAALLQTKAFWELKVIELGQLFVLKLCRGCSLSSLWLMIGTFVVGVAARDGKDELDKPLNERKNSW